MLRHFSQWSRTYFVLIWWDIWFVCVCKLIFHCLDRRIDRSSIILRNLMIEIESKEREEEEEEKVRKDCIVYWSSVRSLMMMMSFSLFFFFAVSLINNEMQIRSSCLCDGLTLQFVCYCANANKLYYPARKRRRRRRKKRERKTASGRDGTWAQILWPKQRINIRKDS